MCFVYSTCSLFVQFQMHVEGRLSYSRNWCLQVVSCVILRVNMSKSVFEIWLKELASTTWSFMTDGISQHGFLHTGSELEDTQ